jgi:putative oxidoreductase
VGGITCTERWFDALGFRPAWVHARLAAATEPGAAAMMLPGLVTPPACAAYVGLMVVAAFIDHRGKGFFVFKGGWDYVGLVGLVAIAVAALGPGRWSVNAAIPWHPLGLAWAVFALVLGLLSATALLSVLPGRILCCAGVRG